ISPKAFKENRVPGAGVFYDLGAHMIDQAIALFGIPSEFSKTYGKFRENTEVDDYAQAHLKYDNGLNVYVTTNMLVVKPQPAYTFYGIKGTLIKHRSDVQETQLLSGMKPLDKGYGEEQKGNEGILFTLNTNGEIIEEQIPLEKGNYMFLFDAVYDTIVNDQEYFAKQNDILTQLSILEK
ncbi:MAG: oxidoreductase, partial [Oligoflexus sp.]|nr:oxidoreductase [Pseudopedobacter sp.]